MQEMQIVVLRHWEQGDVHVVHELLMEFGKVLFGQVDAFTQLSLFKYVLFEHEVQLDWVLLQLEQVELQRLQVKIPDEFTTKEPF